MNSVFLLCYAPRVATISRAAFWQSRKRGIVLLGARGEAEAHFKVLGKRIVKPDDLLLYSLEVAGADGYWGECLADVPWRFFTGEETRDNKN